MIIRFILGSDGKEILDISTETPLYVVIRDVFYSGDWSRMKKDFSENSEVLEVIKSLEHIEEKYATLNELIYEPIVWTELKDFIESKGIDFSSMENITLDGLYELAVDYTDKSLNDIAKDILLYMIKVDKTYAPAYELYGSILLEEGQVDEAIRFLDKSIELDPWLVQSYSMLGDAYYNIGKYDEAIRYWEEEIKYSPNNIFTYFMLADAYNKSNRPEKAIEVLEFLRKNVENNIIALYELANLYRSIGNEAKAREYESLIMEIDPEKDPNGIEIWSKLQLQRGNYEKVVETIKKVFSARTNESLCELILAIAYIKKGDVDLARSIINSVKNDNFWYVYGKKQFFDEFLSEEEKQLCGIN